MNLEIILKTIRKFVLSPLLFYSIYLVIIYSNDFWIKMIGTSYLAISIILLITSSIAIYFSILFFGESNRKKSYKTLYFLFTIISFLVSISLIYLTRDIKAMESVYWIGLFLSANINTFFVSCFNQLYDSNSLINKFVHTRIISVHDSLICITIITFIIYIYFTFSFKKVQKIKQLKRPKKIKSTKLSQQTDNIQNSIDDNEDQNTLIHDDNPFAPIDVNSNPPDDIVMPPWVIPQSESTEPSNQQPWVLPAADQDLDQNQNANPTVPEPQPQNQQQTRPQIQPANEYEYEYEYDYD